MVGYCGITMGLLWDYYGITMFKTPLFLLMIDDMGLYYITNILENITDTYTETCNGWTWAFKLDKKEVIHGSFPNNNTSFQGYVVLVSLCTCFSFFYISDTAIPLKFATHHFCANVV